MPGNVSFYYAIFKKFQLATRSLPYGYGHLSPDTDEDLAGGFSLRHPNHKYGIFGALAPNAGMFGAPYVIQPGWMPLNPNSLVPTENPLYAMLAASLLATPPVSVTVAGQQWPVMPQPPSPPSPTDPWVVFNTAPHRLIDAFADWIAAGKLNDTPKSFALTYDSWVANPPKLFPGLPDLNKPGSKETPILFVASMPGDDGRRHGDHGTPDVPLDHVPDNFWNTSQIFLTNEQGATQTPATLKSGEEYYVTALIGNSGNWGAGSAMAPPAINVLCDAFAFNTAFSPNTPLPSLSNLDPASPAAAYEQYYLAPEMWDVAGFRFNVNSVFAKLKVALAAANMDLGGATVDEWLANSHACVKVRITQGEGDNIYKPAGNAPLTLTSNPRIDRHIAQRNLAPFEITMQGAKMIKWANFVVSQEGKGSNSLILEHGLPLDAFSFYLALTKRTYERYVAKTGQIAGFELVRDAPDNPVAKPFPGAVLLRQTANDAIGATHIDVAAHDGEPCLGMSLGIAWDPSRKKPPRLGDVSMIHHGGDRAIAGGFTLRLVAARTRLVRKL